MICNKAKFQNPLETLAGFYVLVPKRLFKDFKKWVALVLIFTFSSSQLLFAADPRELLAQAKAGFEEPDMPRLGGSAPSQLTSTQSQQQSVVDQQNNLQELQNLNFTLTTQNGDLLKYVNNTLKEVKTQDGNILQNVQVDAQGLIQNADLHLLDGSIQVLTNGKIRAYTLPDNSHIQFDEAGKPTQLTTAQGKIYTYQYNYRPDGSLMRIILVSGRERFTYTPSGVLVKVNKENGERFRFNNGRLIEYMDAGKRIYAYTEEKLSSNQYRVKLSSSSLTNPELPKEILYENTNVLKEVALLNGTKLKFQNGELFEVKDKDNNTVQFDFEESLFGNLAQTSIIQNNVNSSYDEKGILQSVKLGDVTLHYKEDASLDYIEEADGTTIEDIVFDSTNTIQNATVVTPSGEVRTYENGLLKEVTQQDTHIFYNLGKPLKLTQNDLTYDFSYTLTKIEANVESTQGLADSSVIQYEYDENFNLKKEILKDQSIIEYLDDTDYLFKLTKDNTVSFYDKQNQIQKTVINPTTGNSDTLNVIYKYGKIREIYKNDTLTFKYSYSFDTDNSEKTIIEDLEERSTKTYKNELLLTSLDNENSVLSTYSYETADQRLETADSKVKEVDVARLGRQLHHYTYSYEGTNTVVQDEEGVKRTYNPDNKLIYLEKDNKKWGYSYKKNQATSAIASIDTNQEIVTEELLENHLPDGWVAHYDNGRLTRIDKPEDSAIHYFISDVASYPDGTLEQATLNLEDGTKKIFNNQAVIEVIPPGGPEFHYENGTLVKVVKDGRDLHYSFDKNSQGNILTTWVKVDDSDFYLKYDASGNLLGLKKDAYPEVQDVLNSMTNLYLGGLDGDRQADGDFETYHYAYHQGNNSSIAIEGIHRFTSPQVIDQLKYQVRLQGWSNANYDNSIGGYYDIFYQKEGDEAWYAVEGARNGYGSGGYHNPSNFIVNPGIITQDTHLENITALKIRAFMDYHGNNAPSGDINAYIYEFQFTLADQANYAFFQSPEGLAFNGYKGSIQFDAQGNLVSSSPGLEEMANMAGVIQALITNPYAANTHLETESNVALWAKAAADSILDSQAVTLQEYSSDGILETQFKADGTLTLFDDAGKPSQVVDTNGVTLINYSYDENHNLSKVFLKNARKVLPEQVAEASYLIEKSKRDQLLELAGQKHLVTQNIRDQFSFNEEELIARLADIQFQQEYVSGINVRGKQARSQKSDALRQIEDVKNQVQEALTNLYKQESQAYASLDSEVETLSDQIEADSQRALNELHTQEENLKHEILRQEVSPIVYDYYRRILGRDPSGEEYENWITEVNYDSLDNTNFITTLNSSLLSSQELKDRQAYVQTIQKNVSMALDVYLGNSTQEFKNSFLNIFGLSEEETINLTKSDANKIKEWLNTRSLHFGQSAFISLENLLDQKGISYNREELAFKCILVDILTGIISPLDDGDLVISMFALNKVAKLYGLELSGANLSWDDLKTLYNSTTQNPKIIAHINGNHYVVVTNITDDTITYIDPGAGADKHNEVVTISKKDFLKAWKGNVTLESSVLQQSTIHDAQSKILSASETQKIRGAFFFFFAALIGQAIASIGAAIGAVLASIGSVLASIGGMIANIISGIGQVLGGIAQGIGYIGHALWEGIHFAASTLFGGFGNPGTLLSQASFGSAVQASFGQQIFQTAVKLGLNFALSKGLDSLGISPVFSNLVSSFVTGGVSSGFKTGFNAVTFIDGGIKNLAIQGSQSLLSYSGLDSNLQAAIKIFADGFSDGLATIKLGNGVPSIITENLAKASAFYGLTELGSSIGLSNSVAGAFALPLVGSIGRSINTGHFIGEDIVQSVRDGITGSVVQAGLDFAIDQMDIESPLLQALSSSVLTRSVSSLLDPNGNVIEDLLKSAGEFGQKFLGEITSTEFIRYASEYGTTNALQAYATSIFSRQAMEEIHGMGGISQIISGRAKHIDYNGTTLTQVNITSSEGFVLGENGQFVGTFKTINGVREEAFGQFDIGASRSKLINGTVRQVHPNGQVSYIQVQNGKAYRLVLTTQSSYTSEATVKVVGTSSENRYITFDLKEGQTHEPVWNWEVVENYDGELNISGTNIVDGLFFVNGEISFNISDLFGNSLGLELSDGPGTSTDDRLGEDLYVLTNGILNDQSKTEGSPQYLDNLREDIVAQSENTIDKKDIITAATFFTSPVVNALLEKVAELAGVGGIMGEILTRVGGEILTKIFNGSKDVLTWIAEAADPYSASTLVNEIQTAMKAYFDFYGQDNRFRDIIAVGYSGGFVPTIEALTAPGYHAKTYVALGAATINPEAAAKDLLVKVMEAADYLANPVNLTREALRAILGSTEQALIGQLGVGLGREVIEQIVEFVAQETPKEAYNRYIQRLGELGGLIDNTFNGFALDDLTQTGAHMIVNVYGTKDILGDIKINGTALGGYRDKIAGFTAIDRDHALVNIEIEGATHFDYMRAAPPGLDGGVIDWGAYLLTDKGWNETVSTFVADIAVNAADYDTLRLFLIRQRDAGIAEEVGDKWIIHLPGWNSRV